MNGQDPTDGPLLQVRDLTVLAGRQPLVQDVSFELAAGERVGLIGASGSGKSVTCMAIAGLLADGLTAGGSVQLTGTGELLTRSERGWAEVRGSRVGMVFQEPMTALNPTMRVGRQVAEAMRLHGTDRSTANRAAVDLLAAVDLPDPDRLATAYPHQLSGGQRQRVVLAMAMANQPDLLICDEPTTALDVTVQAKVLQLIDDRAAAAGSAVLFISHDLAVVASLCDRLLVMYQGRVVEHGSVVEVLTAPRHPHTRQLLADSELAPADGAAEADAGDR
ncbi:ABC transporter ATP-binding protein [Nakamurella aerolata]|uniref:ABC transporter ATP-binding protein n=1 Tax=Nakamurella aerolata TaxID=1656892 RepID=A0A849A764_9ACTN|nr:ABC transporter ATP-binding protein [Nakamurella aerolata]NNG34340.1 ABC transporter ATP-binding protein [Nakamurella aerolata]